MRRYVFKSRGRVRLTISRQNHQIVWKLQPRRLKTWKENFKVHIIIIFIIIVVVWILTYHSNLAVRHRIVVNRGMGKSGYGRKNKSAVETLFLKMHAINKEMRGSEPSRT